MGHVTQTNGECWSLGLMRDGAGCITAGNDGELKVWSINVSMMAEKAGANIQNEQNILKEQGTLYRQGRDGPVAVKFYPKRDLIAELEAREPNIHG